MYSGGFGDGVVFINFLGVVLLLFMFISFDVFLEEIYVLLCWVIEDEVNIDYFIIEKICMGRVFEWVGEELVVGFSLLEEKLYYEMKDENFYLGVFFYCLKIIDFDGLVSYFYLVEVNYD